MKKWGIRLIGIFFLLGAISNLVGLITGINPPRGFLGVSFISPFQFDIMAWIGVYVQSYTAYHLLRRNPQGHKWALIVLWLSVFMLGLGLVYTTILSLKSHIFPLSIMMTINYWGYLLKVDKPGSFFAITGCVFLFYAIQIYFLMRKDVIMEFQRQEPLEVKPESA